MLLYYFSSLYMAIERKEQQRRVTTILYTLQMQNVIWDQ